MRDKSILFILVCLFASCALPPPPLREMPVVRVGLDEGLDVVHFELSGPFYLVSKTDSRRFPAQTAGNWSIQVSHGAASAALLFTAPDAQQWRCDAPVRIAGCQVTCKNMRVGKGYHWEHVEDRTYEGDIEVQIDDDGKIRIINVVPLETYLEGVLPGEMSPSFPLEALKAQAIAARTFLLYNFGRVHRGENYDVCDDVHCQVYVGAAETSEQILKALSGTRGLVLALHDELCLTPYSAVCGGHTEQAENVWDGSGRTYLQGTFDHPASASMQSYDLSQEQNVRQWIESRPKVFCNIRLAGNPRFAAYSENYFRWERSISRQDLEKAIAVKTGRTIGSLLDIRPVRRGVSGRLMEVMVCGTEDTLTISKELNIRTAFSANALFSACFVVEKKMMQDSLAGEFLFKGAGWGHGVGMCQIGAAMMALGGRTCKEILGHYYHGTTVKAVY